jgi:hypothetical protein
MPDARTPSVAPEQIDLVGTWRLVSVTSWKNGAMTNAHAMGRAPAGYITYTAAGRMMVVLDRRSMPAPAAARLAGAEQVFAYAGPYTRTGGTVIHHLEICTTVPDIGADYVRQIEVSGRHLLLCTEPVRKGDNVYVSKLEWERDGSS